MITQILAGLETSIEGTRESLTIDIKELKSTQANIKNAITQVQSKWKLHKV